MDLIITAPPVLLMLKDNPGFQQVGRDYVQETMIGVLAAAALSTLVPTVASARGFGGGYHGGFRGGGFHGGFGGAGLALAAVGLGLGLAARTVRVVVHEDDWKWGPSEKYTFREHEGRGYWRGDTWTTW